MLLEAARQTVHRVDQHPDEEAHQELGHQRVDVDRDRRVQQRGDEEELRDGEAALSSAIATSADTTMNSAFRMLLPAMMRERWLGSDGVWIACTAARCRSRRRRRSARGRRGRASAPARARKSATPRSRRPARRRREVQVDGEQRQADRAERHQADLDPAAREPLAQERADADADREDREQQRDHVSLPPRMSLV